MAKNLGADVPKKVEEPEVESEAKVKLRAIIEAYKIANPVKAAQKKAEFERKLAAL